METVILPYTNGTTHSTIELTSEIYGGEVYEYYPLGKYIVAAPSVCGGRPTFKYTRIDVSMILAQLSIGRTMEEIVTDYDRPELTVEAIREALLLAGKALEQLASTKQLISKTTFTMA